MTTTSYVRVVLAYLRWWASEVRWAVQTVGYWVRPYDMLADRRRWRWQRPEPCGREVFAAWQREHAANEWDRGLE